MCGFGHILSANGLDVAAEKPADVRVSQIAYGADAITIPIFAIE